jgi:ABC-type dipeptide/oligopeptide/nickel transport system permease component
VIGLYVAILVLANVARNFLTWGADLSVARFKSRLQLEIGKMAMNARISEIENARYREEIGDSSTYVERRLKQDYPEKYKEYQRKKETLEGCKLPLLDYGIWPLVVAVVCGILFCKVLVETKDLMLTAQSFAVLGVIALGVFIGIKCESLIVGGLCIALMIWGVGRFPENVIGVIGLVLGVAIPLVCVPSTIMSMRWNSAWNAEDGYYHGTIEPLEKKIIEEASGKWGPLVGVENLMELKPTGKSA